MAPVPIQGRGRLAALPLHPPAERLPGAIWLFFQVKLSNQIIYFLHATKPRRTVCLQYGVTVAFTFTAKILIQWWASIVIRVEIADIVLYPRRFRERKKYLRENIGSGDIPSESSIWHLNWDWEGTFG